MAHLAEHTDEPSRIVFYSDQKELKNKYGVEHLVVNLGTFLKLSDGVDELEKINARIVSAKKASES